MMSLLNCCLKIISSFLRTKKFKQMTSNRFMSARKVYVLTVDAIVVPANKTETTFQEMAGFSFVVLRDIGIWQRIIEDNIPNAKFIYQAEVDDFNEIRRYSSLPYFTTNITQLTRERQVHNRRLEMPITDETAQIDFYLAYLKTNKSHFKVDITAIQTAWAHLK